MDKRSLKKHILYFALWRFQDAPIEEQRSELALMLDKDVTLATWARFHDLLQEMVDNASSKLD